MLRYSLLVLILLYSAVTIKGQDNALVPYIDFLEKQKTDPVDYVFDLFDRYDIVILGERDHRDTTQYVLIEKIMSDPRFIQNVGHVFTEVGVCNQTDNANRVLKNNYNSEEDFTHDLRNLYRDIDWEVIWEKYNYWYFLNSIYQINKNLSFDEKITLHLTDVPFDWTTCKDTTDRKEFWHRISLSNYRDLAMGINIIQGFDRILQDNNDSRKKALVVLNGRHSYQNYIRTKKSDDSWYPLNSAASYVFDYYPGKVANVMINWYKIKNSQNKDSIIADGKWDAAFHFLKNPSIGFDMESSPFGEDLFDHNPKPASNNTKYKDIYTGFIFYLPIEEWELIIGIPDIITEDFHAELMRREEISRLATGRRVLSLASYIKYYNDKRKIRKDNEELIQNIKKWNVKQ